MLRKILAYQKKIRNNENVLERALMPTKEIKALVIDDDKNILIFLEKILRNEEYGIMTTTDPNEALSILEKEPSIKVVMSDQSMPVMTGIELLNIVKSKYPDIIRMLFTAESDIKAAELAINIGEVYRFILKPWNTEDLKSAFKQALQHYDLIIENRKYLKETERKNAELELLNTKLTNLYENQKEFTSTVSHELKTPLASIKSTVDLVLSEIPGTLNADQRKFLTKTKDNVDRLNKLIQTILDLTRLETGKRQLELSTNDLHKIIEAVVECQRPMAEKKNLRIHINSQKNINPFAFDVDKIYQVLNNLIENAIKFTDEGEISISYSKNIDKNEIQVSIKDTGEGIKKDDQKKIFEKFIQLGNSLKHASGTGLGLALCKEIISRHKGKIWVESEIGKESCFHFTLPL